MDVNKKNKIDRVIKPLLDELNRYNGIHTFASCQGHEIGDGGYVAFTVDNYDCLKKISAILDSILIEMFGWWDEADGEGTFMSHLELHEPRENKISVSLQFDIEKTFWRYRAIRFVAARLRTIRIMLPKLSENVPQLTFVEFDTPRTLARNWIITNEMRQALRGIARKYNLSNDDVFGKIQCLLQTDFGPDAGLRENRNPLRDPKLLR